MAMRAVSRVLTRGVKGVTSQHTAPAMTSWRSFGSDETLELTALNAFHKETGGKMVPFAGYELPVQFKGLGVMKEHMHTRGDGTASVFDVSHMGQLKFHGKDAAKFLETVLPGDMQNLAPSNCRLSVITNEEGGILDDCVVTNGGDHMGVVVNGACKYADMEHFNEQLAAFDGDVAMEYFHEQQLIALQGSGAAAALNPLVDGDVNALSFMQGAAMKMGGVDVHVTRCGYTGEDGFEISMPWDDTVTLTQKLLGQDGVQPAGLGARDSLRLEAGLCLYGHDLGPDTSPVEAALLWTIPKARREAGGFVGAAAIQKQIKEGASRKRVGLLVKGAPSREGCKIFAEDGETEVGTITSGTMSPCLKSVIAMGYVARGHFKLGTNLKVQVRNKMQDAVVSKMPFVPARYHKG